MYIRLTLAAVLILCLFGTVMGTDTKDDILIQKQEMEKIKREVKKSREKLDSLKQNEVEIQKMISDSDQKLATNKTVISRLNRELRQLKQKIAESGSELEQRQLELDLTRRRYLGNIRQFYLTAHKPPEIFSHGVVAIVCAQVFYGNAQRTVKIFVQVRVVTCLSLHYFHGR